MVVGYYVRVSSEDQVEHGYSLAHQREVCRSAAQAMGAEDIREFADEGVPGSVANRPGLNALREAVRLGAIHAVIVWDPDRLARNLSLQLLVTEEIEKAGVELRFLNFERVRGAEGQMFYALRGAISQFERDKIRERTTVGRMQRIRSGKVPTGFSIFGYQYDPSCGTYVHNEREAAVVRRMYDWLIDEQMSMAAIAKRLVAEGVPTKRGGQWQTATVRTILTNAIHKGIFYANRYDCGGATVNRYLPEGDRRKSSIRDSAEWVPVAVLPIISEARWEQAQEVLRDIKRLHTGRERDYLLKGLLICGRCGMTMYGLTSPYWRRGYVRWYTCKRHNATGADPSCGRHVRMDEVDAVVWAEVSGWFRDPDKLLAALPPGDQGEIKRRIDAIREKQAEKKEARRKIADRIASGLLPEEDADRALREIKHEVEQMERRRKELEAVLARDRAAQRPAEEWRRLAQSFLENLDILSPSERRVLIRASVKRIEVGEGEVRITPRFAVEAPVATTLPAGRAARKRQARESV